MRIAICQVDGKWANLALAKLAAWHKAQGDDVEHFMPLAQYDRVYASKVFRDTPDNPYLPVHAAIGGSGYGGTYTLNDEVEATRPDFSLWPRWPHDLGYSTRGCPNRCGFCIVPQKEGRLRVVADFGDLTTGRATMILHDNNVTAAPIEHFRRFCADATTAGVTIDFRQGLDARRLTDEHAAIIAASKFARRIHFAWDRIEDEPAVRRAIATMQQAGIPPSRLTFYVLAGYDSTFEDDMHRIETLRALGTDPFVMVYGKPDVTLRRLARWVNNKVAFKAMSWSEWCATFKTPLPEPVPS